MVTWSEFRRAYMGANAKKKFNQKECGDIWKKLRRDNGCYGSIYDKKIFSKDWPSEFHAAATSQIQQWKLDKIANKAEETAKKARKVSNFFAMFNNGSKASTARKPSNKSSNKATTTTVAPNPSTNPLKRARAPSPNPSTNPLKRARAPSPNPSTNPLKRAKRAKYEASSPLKHAAPVDPYLSIFNEFKTWFKYNSVIQDSLIQKWSVDKTYAQFQQLIVDKSYVQLVHSSIELSPSDITFAALIENHRINFGSSDQIDILLSNEFDHQYDTLATQLKSNNYYLHLISDGKLLNNLSLDLEHHRPVAVAPYSIHAMRNLLVWIELIKAHRILKCRSQFSLHTNYINRNTSTAIRRTQQQDVDEIKEIGAKLSKLSALSLSQTAKYRDRLLKRRDKVYQLLIKKKLNTKSQRKSRAKRKSRLFEAGISMRNKPGPLPIEIREPEFKLALQNCLESNCESDPRLRTHTAQTLYSVNQVTAIMNDMGFKLSKSTVHRRFIPDSKSKIYKARYHSRALDFKFGKAQNNRTKYHIAEKFGNAERRNLKEMCSYLGSKGAIWLSQDDKDKIKIGVTMVNKQNKIVLDIAKPTEMMDHDFVYGAGYKLNLSVTKICNVLDNAIGESSAVTYIGHVDLCVRSSKHDRSTATAHQQDIMHLMESKPYLFYGVDGLLGAMVMSADGGPDENVKYIKNILAWTLFFIEIKPATLIVLNTVPHQSKFNEAERTMPFINDQISGCVLDPAYYGAAVKNGKTVDAEKEQWNFEAAGIDLVNLLNKVAAERNWEARWEPPTKEDYERDRAVLSKLFTYFPTLTDLYIYFQTHLEMAQYSIQFCHCQNSACKLCPIKYRTDYYKLNASSNNYPFIPSIVPVVHAGDTSKLTIDSKKGHYAHYTDCLNFNGLPRLSRDVFNPQINKREIKDRTCAKCNKYFNSKARRKEHDKLKVCDKILQMNEGNYTEEEDDAQNVMDLFCKLNGSQHLSEAKRILKKNENEWLVEYNDGDKEWLNINLLNKHKELLHEIDTFDEMEHKNCEPIRIPLTDVPLFLNWSTSNLESVDEISLFQESAAKRIDTAKKALIKKQKKDAIQPPQIAHKEYEKDKYQYKEYSMEAEHVEILSNFVPKLRKGKKSKKKKQKQKQKKKRKQKEKRKINQEDSSDDDIPIIVRKINQEDSSDEDIDSSDDDIPLCNKG